MQRMQIKRSDLRPLPLRRLKTAKEGAELEILGETALPVRATLGSSDKIFKFRPVVVKGLTMDANLSLPFLQKNQIDQLHSRGCLRVGGREMQLMTADGKPTEIRCSTLQSFIYSSRAVKVPAFSWAEFPISVAAVQEGKMSSGDGLVIGEDEFMHKTGLHPLRRSIVACTKEGYALAAVLNMTDEELLVPAGQRYGTFALVPQKREEAEQETREWTEEQKDKWLWEEFQLGNSPFLRTPRLKEEALTVLKKHWAIYSTDGSFGKTSLLKHAIHTEQQPPIKMRFRPVNPALEENLKEQLETWLQHDVIEESNSPWAFALVAVRKKNGKIRWCVDYRKLNAITKKDSFPLPQIEDNLARLADSKVFSGIDGMGAFHVVELEEGAKPKTAFATPWGTYQFKRMPFGLSNGPATYSRLMQMALQGIPTSVALPYLDDTIVHSSSMQQHFHALDQVLGAHAKAGLKLQPSKCQLFQEEIEYLGHMVSKHGIRPVPEYTQVIADWPLPHCKTEVRAWLGKTGYYQRFMRNYAALAKPWTDALKQEGGDRQPIEVSEDMKSSFDRMKRALMEAPILAYPRFEEENPFILDTDWSQETNTIGAVLSQEQDGEERVISYGAKKLSKSQQNYPPTKGELCAVIYFMRHWRYYLAFRPFILRTDHKALSWIKTMDQPTGMIQRWLETLATFDFEVQHREGKKHGNADGLSRITHAPEAVDLDEEGEEEVTANLWRPTATSQQTLHDLRTSVTAIQIQQNELQLDALAIHSLQDLRKGVNLPRTTQGWRNEQIQDPVLNQVVKWALDDTWPDEQQQKSLSPALRHYAEKGDQLYLDEHGLLRVHEELVMGEETGLICLPQQLVRELIWAAHRLAGHQGVEATLKRMTALVHFPRMRSEVREIIETCVACQRKAEAQKDQRHTYATVIDGYPFQRLSLDFVGPLPPSRRRNSYLLTVKDGCTRWIEAFPIKEATAEKVAEKLENEVFSRFGYPETLHSDQGRQFTGTLMKQLGELLDIVVTHTPAYNPKSNPVERTHRDIKAALRALQEEGNDDWEEALPQVLFALRTAVNRSTGFSPFQLMFGRDPHVPLAQVEVPPAHTPAPGEKISDYIRKFRRKMEAVQEVAREHLAESVARQRRYYRKSLHEFQEGQKVWLYTPASGAGVYRKFHRGWTGPWTIARRLNLTMYELEPAEGWAWRASLAVSMDRLKPYFTPKEPLERYEPNPADDPGEYEQRGNEHLEQLERPLPKGPAARDPQQSEDSDDDDEEPAKRRRLGPRPPRPGPAEGRPAPVMRLPAPVPRPERAPEECRQHQPPRFEPTPDLEWDRYDLQENPPVTPAETPRKRGRLFLRRRLRFAGRETPPPLTPAQRVAWSRSQEAERGRMQVREKRTPPPPYNSPVPEGLPEEGVEEKETTPQWFTPAAETDSEEEEEERAPPLMLRRLQDSPGFRGATASPGPRPRREAAIRGEAARRAADGGAAPEH